MSNRVASQALVVIPDFPYTVYSLSFVPGSGSNLNLPVRVSSESTSGTESAETGQTTLGRTTPEKGRED